MNNSIEIYSLAVIAIFLVGGLSFLVKKYNKIAVDVTKIVSESVDILKETSKGKLGDKKEGVIDFMSKLSKIAVDLTEKFSENVDIHGTEKKDMAIDCFHKLTEALDLKENDLNEKTVDVMIENAVSVMNKEKTEEKPENVIKANDNDDTSKVKEEKIPVEK